MPDKGFITSILDACTGQLASQAVSKIAEKTANSRIAIKLKERLNPEKMNYEIKTLIDNSINISNYALDIDKTTIKENIELHKEVIIGWIIENQIEKESSIKFDQFTYLFNDYENEKHKLSLFFRTLYNNIQKRKNQYIGVGHLKIINDISELNNKIDSISETSNHNNQILMGLYSSVKNIGKKVDPEVQIEFDKKFHNDILTLSFDEKEMWPRWSNDNCSLPEIPPPIIILDDNFNLIQPESRSESIVREIEYYVHKGLVSKIKIKNIAQENMEKEYKFFVEKDNLTDEERVKRLALQEKIKRIKYFNGVALKGLEILFDRKLLDEWCISYPNTRSVLITLWFDRVRNGRIRDGFRSIFMRYNPNIKVLLDFSHDEIIQIRENLIDVISHRSKNPDKKLLEDFKFTLEKFTDREIFDHIRSVTDLPKNVRRKLFVDTLFCVIGEVLDYGEPEAIENLTNEVRKLMIVEEWSFYSS